MKRMIIAVLAMQVCWPAIGAEMAAEQITATNAATHIQHGPDAAAGIGDWFATNGTLCLTVSALNRESDVAATGGALTDVGFCNRADDHIVSFHDMLGATPVRADKIEAAHGDNAARIIVHGNADGVISKTTYALHADKPHTISVRKSYRITGQTQDLSMIPRVWFNYHSMTPYVLNLSNPALSAGTNLKAFLGRPATDIADYAQRADLVIATSNNDDTDVSQGGSGRAIAYGWRHISSVRIKADGTTQTLPTFALAEPNATVYATFTNGFWFEPKGDLGLLQMLQMAIMSPDIGDEIIIEEELIIGAGADAAAITNQLYDGHMVSGQLAQADADAVVHFETAGGQPVTYVRPGADGHFAARLPRGDYRMIVKSAGVDDEVLSFSHAQTDIALGTIGTAEAARLMLPRFAGPMRLTILGTNGTSAPDLADQQLGLTVTGADGIKPITPMGYVYLAGVKGDVRHVDLPAGTYRILASRGIEYSVTETNVKLWAGKQATLQITPPVRMADSAGQLGADFHTHAAPSIDSMMATGDRVTSFIAEGGEIMVAAEHETIFDYTPVLQQTGLRGRVIVVNGSEITSEVSTTRNPYSIGHANAFPLTVKPNSWRRGQPMNEARRWRDVINDVRTQWPDAIMQLNHPTDGKKITVEAGGDPQETAGSRGAFLDHMGPAGRQFDPAKPLDDPHNQTLIEPDAVTGYRDLDFDAVELLNGPWYASYRMMRQMWISWLLQGEIVTGVANSDSHTKGELVGWPRNMVDLGIDHISRYRQSEFVKAVRAGRITGTTGPILSIDLDGARIGDTLAAQSATLNVSVAAPDWAADPSGQYDLRISVNGVIVHDGKIGVGEAQAHPLRFEADGFVLVEVEGEAGPIYQIIAPDHHPLAFTNPIFVDGDGDGVWTAPGL